MKKIYFEMMSAACRQSGLRAEDIREKHVEMEEDCIYLSLLTDYQWYELYLDREDLNLRGINTEPRVEKDLSCTGLSRLTPSDCA